MARKKHKPEIEYSGQHSPGSKLSRVIINHYDEGERLLGMYEVWATKEAVANKFSDARIKFDEKLRSCAIDGFEDILKHNEENSTNHTAVFIDKNKPPKYGDYRKFPAMLSKIDPTIRTNVSMPESLYRWVRIQAAKENSSVSGVINQALTSHKEMACPKCGGNNVKKTELSHGVGSGKVPPKAISKQYQCLDCKNFLNYPRLSK